MNETYKKFYKVRNSFKVSNDNQERFSPRKINQYYFHGTDMTQIPVETNSIHFIPY